MKISRRRYLAATAIGGGALLAGGAGAAIRYWTGRGPDGRGALAGESATPPPAGDGVAAPRREYKPLGKSLARDSGEWENSPAVKTDGSGGVFYSKRANWWLKKDGGAVECALCPRRCTVPPGGTGRCRVRANSGGEYRTLAWGNPCALHVDPVEKKPFFHVMPGAKALSLATVGCNITCKFCQNWNISQASPGDVEAADKKPGDIARAAKDAGCPLVAFTYSEPVVFWEYMRDCAEAARELGIGSVVVSNGFIETAPLKRLLESVTAVKVDLKGFTEAFYRDVCDGELKPVLRTLETLAASGSWFEIVYLVVPTLNDDPKDVAAMCRWIAKELGTSAPLHFSVFHPAYKLLRLPETPIATVLDCAKAAKDAGLRFVYVGNDWGNKLESTWCPGCGALLIGRYAYEVTARNYDVTGGKALCRKCRAELPGVFK